MLRAPHEDTSRWPRTFDWVDARFCSSSFPSPDFSSSTSSKSSNGGVWRRRRRQIARRGQFVKRGEKLRADYSLDLTRRHPEISRTPRSRGKFRTWWGLLSIRRVFGSLRRSFTHQLFPPLTVHHLAVGRLKSTLFPTDSVAIGGSADRCQSSRLYKRPAARGEERVEQK